MIDLNGIKLRNRFMVSSGALEYGRGWPWQRFLIKTGLIDPNVFGGIVTRTLTLEPRRGNYIDPFEFENATFMSHLCRIFSAERKKVLRKIPGGWMNNLSWWNVGVDYWVKKIYPQLGKNIIVSIGGFSGEEYLALIEKINELNVLAIELNVSCPNVEEPREFRKDLPHLFRRAKSVSAHPLILKIGHTDEDIYLAQTAAALGLNVISAINAIPGVIMTESGVFKGGQSGGRIKETALLTIIKLKEALRISKVPIIGGGGICCWRDCQDFFQAGADAVSFGSVHLTSPFKPTKIVKKYEKRV